MEKIKKRVKISNSDSYIQIFIQQSNYNIGTFTDVPYLFNDETHVDNLFNKFVRLPHRTLQSFNYGQLKPKITAYGVSELQYFYRYGNIESYSERFIRKQYEISSLDFHRTQGLDVKDVFISKRIFFEEIQQPTLLDAPESEIIEDINAVNIENINTQPREYFEYRYGIGINDENVEFPTIGLAYTELETENGFETTVKYMAQGYNYTNSSMYANIKEEHLLGISDKHETESNINIDRKNGINVFEIIQKLGEINNVEHLSHYNNGEFNIIK